GVGMDITATRSCDVDSLGQTRASRSARHAHTTPPYSAAAHANQRAPAADSGATKHPIREYTAAPTPTSSVAVPPPQIRHSSVHGALPCLRQTAPARGPGDTNTRAWQCPPSPAHH